MEGQGYLQIYEGSLFDQQFKQNLKRKLCSLLFYVALISTNFIKFCFLIVFKCINIQTLTRRHKLNQKNNKASKRHSKHYNQHQEIFYNVLIQQMARNSNDLYIFWQARSLDRSGGPYNQTVDSFSYRTYSMNSDEGEAEEQRKEYREKVKQCKDVIQQILSNNLHDKLLKGLQTNSVNQLQMIQCSQHYIDMRKRLAIKKQERKVFYFSLLSFFQEKINQTQLPNSKSFKKKHQIKKQMMEIQDEQFQIHNEQDKAFQLIKQQVSALQNAYQIKRFQKKQQNQKQSMFKDLKINKEKMGQEKSIMVKTMEKKSGFTRNYPNLNRDITIYEAELQESRSQIKKEIKQQQIHQKQLNKEHNKIKRVKSPVSRINRQLSPKNKGEIKIQNAQKIKLIQSNCSFTIMKPLYGSNITFISDLPIKIDLKLNQYNLMAEIREENKLSYNINILNSSPKILRKQCNLPYTNECLLLWHQPISMKFPQTEITETAFKNYSFVEKFSNENVTYQIRKQSGQFKCQGNQILSLKIFSGESESCNGKRMTVERYKQSPNTVGKIISTTWYILKRVNGKPKGITQINVRVLSHQ